MKVSLPPMRNLHTPLIKKMLIPLELPATAADAGFLKKFLDQKQQD